MTGVKTLTNAHGHGSEPPGSPSQMLRLQRSSSRYPKTCQRVRQMRRRLQQVPFSSTQAPRHVSHHQQLWPLDHRCHSPLLNDCMRRIMASWVWRCNKLKIHDNETSYWKLTVHMRMFMIVAVNKGRIWMLVTYRENEISNWWSNSNYYLLDYIFEVWLRFCFRFSSTSW